MAVRAVCEGRVQKPAKSVSAKTAWDVVFSQTPIVPDTAVATH